MENKLSWKNIFALKLNKKEVSSMMMDNTYFYGPELLGKSFVKKKQPRKHYKFT